MISFAYRRWIQSLGCHIDSCPNAFKRVDACHTGGRGLGQKTSDLSCVNFCRFHHKQYDANPRAFCEKYKVNIPALVESLNQLGLKGIRLHRPARKVQSPEFVRTACICGWKSGWFRKYEDALDSLHWHLSDAEELDRAKAAESAA